MKRTFFVCLAFLPSILAAAAAGTGCNPLLTTSCASSADCNAGRTCVASTCVALSAAPGDDGGAVATSPIVDDTAEAIAAACAEPEGMRYTARSAAELQTLLQGRWAPCPSQAGTLPDPALLGGFVVDGTSWSYATGADAGAGTLITLPDPMTTTYLDFALASPGGSEVSLWAAFSESRGRLVLGPRPITTSGETYFVRVRPPAPVTSGTVFRRAEGDGPIGDVALVNRPTTPCADAAADGSCPLTSIDWKGLDVVDGGFDPVAGWYTGETLVGGQLEGGTLVVERVWRIIGGIGSPLELAKRQLDGPPLVGTFTAGAPGKLELVNEDQSRCPADAQLADGCASTSFGWASAGLTPDQQARVTAASATPDRVLFHGSLDPQGLLAVDAVWLDITSF